MLAARRSDLVHGVEGVLQNATHFGPLFLRPSSKTFSVSASFGGEHPISETQLEGSCVVLASGVICSARMKQRS